MRCIIVDDEPIARRGIAKLAGNIPSLEIAGSFENADAAAKFMTDNAVDLIFLDIQMPGTNGLEFAKSIPQTTLVIFTTAFSQYAADSYEVDAVDYLVKPIKPERFKKAVEKAISYHSLLLSEEKNANSEEKNANVEEAENDFIFIKSNRKYYKVYFKDILFIEGLKDYVIIQMDDRQIITHMNVKNMHDLLPKNTFLRINRSYIVNRDNIESFDNNDVFIKKHEIAIGNSYRDTFFEELLKNSRL